MTARTDGSTTVEQHWGIDLEALDKAVASALGVRNGSLRRDLLGGGLSQTTFRYTGQIPEWNDTVIARVPPLHGPLAPYSPTGEAALMRWLGSHDVPVPQVVHAEAHEPHVGRGFVVTAMVDGYVVRDGAPGQPTSVKTDMGAAYVDQLATLHNLSSEPRPDEVLSWAPAKTAHSVVERWTRTLGACEITMPDFHRFLTDWLVRRMPQSPEQTTVVHGDYRLGNVMWSGPAEVAAVLDWEEAGEGAAYFDLGWALMGTKDPHDLVMGIIERAAFLERYAATTGRPIDHELLTWWEVAAGWSRLCMEAKAISLLADGHYADLRPLLSSYLNRRLSVVLLEKIRDFEGRSVPSSALRA